MISILKNLFTGTKVKKFKINNFDLSDSDTSKIWAVYQPIFELAKSNRIKIISSEYFLQAILIEIPNNQILKLIDIYKIPINNLKQVSSKSNHTSGNEIFPELSNECERIFTRACFKNTASNHSEKLTQIDLLCSMLADESLKNIFKDLGLSTLMVSYFDTHNRSLPKKIKDEISLNQNAGSTYWICIENDRHTSMECVIEVLVNVFGYNEEQATGMMLEIHNNNAVSIGPLTFDKAKECCINGLELARNKGYPLGINILTSPVLSKFSLE